MKRAGFRALLVVVAALALAAPANAGWDDPVGKKKPILVIPIRYADWSGPCSPAPCPSSFYDSTFTAASGSINPPYRTAALWGTYLNTAVNDLVLEDSARRPAAATLDWAPQPALLHRPQRRFRTGAGRARRRQRAAVGDRRRCLRIAARGGPADHRTACDPRRAELHLLVGVARLAGASGAFTDSLAPTTAGTWHAQARFQGNAAKGPAESGQCSFPVAVPSPPPAQPRPDLVIDSLKRNSFTVTNRGDGAAGPFTVSVRRGQGGTTRFDFVGLAPGSSLTRNVNCLKGDLTVTADSGETVAESDETNNRTTLLVQSCQ